VLEDSGSYPQDKEVYSLMFIVDIEKKKKKNLKINNKKIKKNFYSKK